MRTKNSTFKDSAFKDEASISERSLPWLERREGSARAAEKAAPPPLPVLSLLLSRVTLAS